VTAEARGSDTTNNDLNYIPYTGTPAECVAEGGTYHEADHRL